MDLAEIRKLIKDSPHKDFLNNIKYSFNLPHIGVSLDFVGLVNIFKFFTENVGGWQLKSLEFSGNHFDQSTSFFTNALHYTKEFLTVYVQNTAYSESDISANFARYSNGYFSPSNQVFTSNAPEVDFLIKLLAKDVNVFAGAYLYFTNQGMSYSSRTSVDGYLLAYEFTHREDSVLFSRRESDKRYISETRNKIEILENDYQNSVISFIKKIESDYDSNNEFQINRAEKSKKILSNWLLHNKTKFSKFLDTSNEEFKILFDDTNQEFSNIQNQYSELLKLQEPVKYWKDRAGELNKKANIMMWVLGGITAIAVVLTYVLLWWTPEGMLESIFNGDKSAAIRWSIVFAIFISFIAFMFRAIMKFMFSNYHLARDAEEREKLTYLYISLLSKGDFSEEEKKIVFQALFSRSDTGLLKEDSSPTMPGISSIIEKNIK